MAFPLDITGRKYGRLTALRFSHRAGKKKTRYWLCRCECGAQTAVTVADLNSGNTVSCGCYRTETIAANSRTHGLSHTKEFDLWTDMKKRCYNKNAAPYKNYGGRGIYVCDKWRNDFTEFLRDMGRCPTGKTLDRRDNNGPYSPSNCRWATRAEQVRNRRNSRFVVTSGVRVSFKELSEQHGIRLDTLYQRATRDNWSLDKITKPPRRVRSIHFIEIDGERFTLTQLSSKSGIPRVRLYQRFFIYHWPLDKLFNPVRRH